MVDVTYGIPLDIRDAALKMAGITNEFATETSTRNREVKAIMGDKQEARQQEKEKDGQVELDEEKRAKARAILETLAAKLNGSKRNVKERAMEIANKDMTKILSRLPFGGTLAHPEDASIKSFFIFGFSPEMPQYALSNYCDKYGHTTLKVIHRSRCAYATFATRKNAEMFASEISANGLSKNPKTAGLVVLDGKYPVRVAWGVPKSLGTSNEEHSKIGTVVVKVMKQLAERDLTPQKKRKKSEIAKKSYKAASGVMEI